MCDTKWHLLNQLYVNLDYQDLEMSVLEEEISSDLQLVSVLVSGTVSQETMSLAIRSSECFNQIVLKGHHL